MAGSTVKVAFLGDARSLEDASARSQKSLDALQKKSADANKKIGGFAQKATAGMGLAVAAIGVFAIKMGSELDDSEVALQNALHNTGQSVASFGSGLEPLLKQNEKWGNSNKTVNESLAVLVRGGDTAKKAIVDETLAANIAAARHYTLAQATDIVAKANIGNTKGLAKLGVALKDASGKTKTHTQLMKELTAKYKGAADTAGGTFQGKINAAKATLTDMAAKLGEKLIPVLEKLGVDVSGVVDWFTKHKAIAMALAIVVGTLVTALIGLAIFTKINDMVKDAKEAWAALNLIMDENPALLIAVAIAAVGLALYEAYKHFSPFRTAVDDVWGALKAAFNWTKANWPLLLAILTGPIGLAVLAIARNWSTIKAGVSAVASWVGDRFTDIVNFVRGLPGRIAAFVGGVASAAANFGKSIATGILHGITGAAADVSNFARSIVNGLIGYINRDVIDRMDQTFAGIHLSFFGHSIGLPSHLIPDIPTLHSGGIFNTTSSEGLALLQNGEGVFTPAQMRALGGMHNGNVTINMPAGVDPAAVVTAQRRYNRRNGL